MGVSILAKSGLKELLADHKKGFKFQSYKEFNRIKY